MIQSKFDVFKVIEFKDGFVFKTKFITSIWIEMKPLTIAEQNEIAAKFGGDMLASTTETRTVTNRSN